MPVETDQALPDFSCLTPEAVLECIEAALNTRTTNLCRPLTSYINRVYEAELEDGRWVVAKFYRPGRWSPDALRDEQTFLVELDAREIPVIAPLRGAADAALHEHQGMRYAVFPRCGGRPLDEPNTTQWLELGRLLARVHAVGSVHPPRDRIKIGPHQSGARHLGYILDSGVLPAAVRGVYEAAVTALLDRVAPLFQGVEAIRIHGDVHRANILQRPGEPLRLIDFDDMAVGPPVQDLWMLLPGHLEHSRPELALLLEGYETFRPFDRSTLRLIEPLRALRFIHYTAWCARQKADGGFARLEPDWGTEAFWRQELQDLERQRQEIEDALERFDPAP